MTPIELYIRQRAPAYGIDPDVAVQVARSEGGLDNPTRQSDVVNGGKRERSYGPFQLLIDGGVGARALAAGIDPRKESDWQAATDFALAEASQKGWGQWYGAKKVGIDDWEGIKGRTGEGPTGAGTTLTSTPVSPTTTATSQDSSLIDKILGLGGSSGSSGGYSGGTRAAPPAPMQLQVPSLKPQGGSEAAARLMAQLLADQRKRYGLSITGMES